MGLSSVQRQAASDSKKSSRACGLASASAEERRGPSHILLKCAVCMQSRQPGRRNRCSAGRAARAVHPRISACGCLDYGAHRRGGWVQLKREKSQYAPISMREDHPRRLTDAQSWVGVGLLLNQGCGGGGASAGEKKEYVFSPLCQHLGCDGRRFAVPSIFSPPVV